jgi:hypothetical protein
MILLTWVLCIVTGVALLFSTRFRFLSLYLILCSICGLLGGVLGEIILFALGVKFPDDGPVRWLAWLTLLITGISVGALLARTINRRMKWQ